MSLNPRILLPWPAIPLCLCRDSVLSGPFEWVQVVRHAQNCDNNQDELEGPMSNERQHSWTV